MAAKATSKSGIVTTTTPIMDPMIDPTMIADEDVSGIPVSGIPIAAVAMEVFVSDDVTSGGFGGAGKVDPGPFTIMLVTIHLLSYKIGPPHFSILSYPHHSIVLHVVYV